MLEDVEKKILTILSFVFGNNKESVTASLVRLPVGFLTNQKSSEIKT